jgi:DNA (cytosine-5)-methyltransferase 1
MADGSLMPEIAANAAYDWTPRRKRIVVGFAGGGGSSIGIAKALGVHPDAALNHWPAAIATHEANFPGAAHFCGDIFETDCRDVLPGEEIGLAWFSPDCRHFSRAKGGTPVSARVRGLAWVVIPWAKIRKPDVIILENVDEFVTWGPLIVGADGATRPDPARKGETFERFVRRLRQCGYEVDWRQSSLAADLGAPTLRKRFILIARRDGRPIVFPAPMFAPRAKAAAKGLPPYRAAYECIDFSRPCPSIFLTREEARAIGVKRPLEDATMRRIARGLYRYSIASADPFIVRVVGTEDRVANIRDPLNTIATEKGGAFALVAPVITGCGGRMGQTEPVAPRDPYPTITSKNDSALAVAHLTHFQENMIGSDLRDPLDTVMAGAPRHGLVSAHITKFRGGATGSDMRDGLPAVTANSFIKRPGGAAPIGLVAAFVEQANTDMVGHDMREPLSTMVQKGCTQRVIAAQLSQFRGSNAGKGDLDEPMPAVMAEGYHQALLAATLEADQPLAVPFSAHDDELRAFLVRYYGTADASDLADPLGTVTSRSRFGLVLVAGVAYRISDIGMRMLDPETELAAAMGVPRGYFAGVRLGGKPLTKTKITKLVGNMVQTEWAEAHVAANCADLPWWREPEAMAA